ncbi:hypothetical protein QWY93_13435 [Echinicola jeungdonensis]|uniref:alkaline phosphatase PhoX n=1 Tax=Echinicola jeungdonensis TaxID=709343 RepID=UPI0025B33B4C|nr:alkaline phosphatase PhoX [Echinicola jeungdonensis]MDN3670325.1 hypothetical protein [Echinicola jeungdonensis]
MRYRGYGKGAARFARGEGIWFGENELYFACTNGGEIGAGQVFKYIPGENEGKENEYKTPGSLELFAEPNDRDLLKNCDNVAIAPWEIYCFARTIPTHLWLGLHRRVGFINWPRILGLNQNLLEGCFPFRANIFCQYPRCRHHPGNNRTLEEFEMRFW